MRGPPGQYRPKGAAQPQFASPHLLAKPFYPASGDYRIHRNDAGSASSGSRGHRSGGGRQHHPIGPQDRLANGWCEVDNNSVTGFVINPPRPWILSSMRYNKNGCVAAMAHSGDGLSPEVLSPIRSL